MGLHTTFLGRVTITPPLTADDVELVRALGPIDADRPAGHDAAPVGESPWAACDDGCCLFWDGVEKPQVPELWLRYLVGLFAPRHRFEGMVVGERQEHRELFALAVEGSCVTRRVLMKGLSDAEAWGALPLDREQSERRAALERRRMRYAAAVARERARQEDEAHDGPAA